MTSNNSGTVPVWMVKSRKTTIRPERDDCDGPRERGVAHDFADVDRRAVDGNEQQAVEASVGLFDGDALAHAERPGEDERDPERTACDDVDVRERAGETEREDNDDQQCEDGCGVEYLERNSMRKSLRATSRTVRQ